MAQKSILYKNQNFDISFEIANFHLPKTLIFLHGWGSNKALMKQVFFESFKEFRHLYIDMPGFGKSKNPPFSLDTKDYAAILSILLNEMKIDEFSIVGHSFGGKVGVLLNPKELILLSSAGILKKKSLKVRMKIALSKKLNQISPALGQIFSQILRSRDVSGMSQVMYETFKKVVDEDFSGIFENFKNQAFIFWGKEDNITPLDCGEKIHGLIKKSHFFSLAGDHYFFLKQAQKIEELYLKAKSI